MRILLACLLLSCANLLAQSEAEFERLVDENIDAFELRGFVTPEFKWDMEGRAQASLNEAINMIAEDHPLQASQELEEAAKLDPNSWVIFYYRGVCLKLVGSEGAAEEMLLKAQQLDRNNYFVALELGKVAELRGKMPAAERYYESAARIDPRQALPVYLQAQLFTKTDRVIRAKKKFADCVEIDSTFLHGEVRLAIIEGIEKKTPDAALKRLGKVLQKDSANRIALLYHALLVYSKDKRSSLRDFDRLVRLDPTSIELRFLRGFLASEIGDYDRGFADLRRVVDERRTDEFRFSGRQTKMDKRMDIEYAGFYVISNVYGLPDEDAALIKKAYCLLFLNGFDDALKAIATVNGSRTNPLCLYLRGVALEHKGVHASAFGAYDSALRYDRDIYDAHKKRGVYFTELERWGDAMYDFNEMFRINPQSVSAYRFRGTVQYYRGDLQAALGDFDKYLAVDSSSRDVHGYRAVVYHDLKQVLPSTLDFLQSNQMHGLPARDTVLNEVLALASTDSAKAMWYVNQFIKHGYNRGYAMQVAVLVSRGDWDRAESYADKFESTTTRQAQIQGSFDRAYVHTIKGMCHARKNQHNEAIDSFNLAIMLNEENGEAHFERAKVFLKQGDEKSAKKDLRRAQKLGILAAGEMLAGLG